MNEAQRKREAARLQKVVLESTDGDIWSEVPDIRDGVAELRTPQVAILPASITVDIWWEGPQAVASCQVPKLTLTAESEKAVKEEMHNAIRDHYAPHFKAKVRAIPVAWGQATYTETTTLSWGLQREPFTVDAVCREMDDELRPEGSSGKRNHSPPEHR